MRAAAVLLCVCATTLPVDATAGYATISKTWNVNCGNASPAFCYYDCNPEPKCVHDMNTNRHWMDETYAFDYGGFWHTINLPCGWTDVQLYFAFGMPKCPSNMPRSGYQTACIDVFPTDGSITNHAVYAMSGCSAYTGCSHTLSTSITTGVTIVNSISGGSRCPTNAKMKYWIPFTSEFFDMTTYRPIKVQSLVFDSPKPNGIFAGTVIETDQRSKGGDLVGQLFLKQWGVPESPPPPSLPSLPPLPPPSASPSPPPHPPPRPRRLLPPRPRRHRRRGHHPSRRTPRWRARPRSTCASHPQPQPARAWRRSPPRCEP